MKQRFVKNYYHISQEKKMLLHFYFLCISFFMYSLQLQSALTTFNDQQLLESENEYTCQLEERLRNIAKKPVTAPEVEELINKGAKVTYAGYTQAILYRSLRKDKDVQQSKNLILLLDSHYLPIKTHCKLLGLEH